MESTNQTNDNFSTQLSINALTNAIMGVSLAESLREELADFISKSTGETKEGVIQRINLRGKEIRQALIKSVSKELEIPFEQVSPEQQNDDSSI